MSLGKEISVGEGQTQILHPFTTKQWLSSFKQFHSMGESKPFVCLSNFSWIFRVNIKQYWRHVNIFASKNNYQFLEEQARNSSKNSLLIYTYKSSYKS